jgi:hypothetical protein
VHDVLEVMMRKGEGDANSEWHPRSHHNSTLIGVETVETVVVKDKAAIIVYDIVWYHSSNGHYNELRQLRPREHKFSSEYM